MSNLIINLFCFVVLSVFSTVGQTASFTNLYINNDPDEVSLNESEFHITADKVQLDYLDGTSIIVFDVDVIANKENDLDVGQIEAEKWYHLYLVRRLSTCEDSLHTVVSLNSKKPENIQYNEAYVYLAAFKTKYVAGEGINIEALRQRNNIAFGKARLEAELLNNKTNELNPIDLTHVPPNAAVWHFRLKVDKNSIGTIDLEIRTEGDNYLINTRKIKIVDVQEIKQDFSILLTEPQRVYYKLNNGKDVKLETIGWEY